MAAIPIIHYASHPYSSNTVDTPNMSSQSTLAKGHGPLPAPYYSNSTATSSSRTSFSTAFPSPSQPTTPDAPQGMSKQDYETITSLELPCTPPSPPPAPLSSHHEHRRPSKGQGLMRRLSNRTTTKLRNRTSNSSLRNREQNAGPTVVRTRSGSRTLNDGAIDTSDLERDDAEEQTRAFADAIAQHYTIPALKTSPLHQARVQRDLDGHPIVPLALRHSMKFLKITKKKRQPIRLSLDSNLKKIIWNFDSQSRRKEVFVDDMTEVRAGKLAQTHVDELGQPGDANDRWLTIVYYDPDTRGRGRSTHAIHMAASDKRICKDLKEYLTTLIQDRRDMMAGVSGNVDDDQSLTRFWTDIIKEKFGNTFPADSEIPALSREDVRRCCHRCLIYMSESDFNSQFDASDAFQRGALGRAEFVDFFRGVRKRPEVEDIFKKYKPTESPVMLQDDFFSFLRHSQGINVAKQYRNCESLFDKYAEPSDLGIIMSEHERPIRQAAMTLEAFKRFFIDDNAPLPSSQSTPKFDRPLNEYFISSSHNTYLTGRQVGGHSSTEPYVDCLKQGCRCLEVDCWDGDDGQPWVTHGRTVTKGISFLSVIKAINLWAFRASPYPLIISLEVHCNPAQQLAMVDIMKKQFGRKLLTSPISAPTDRLPSPEQLQGYILIKVKEPMQTAQSPSSPLYSNQSLHRRTRSKSEADALSSSPRPQPQTAAEARVAPILLGPSHRAATYNPRLQRSALFSNATSSDETESDDELRSSKQKRPRTSKIVPELGNLGVYTGGIKFSDFNSYESHKPSHVYSFNENTFKGKCATPQMQARLEKHNQQYLMRVYPKGSRIFSDNFDPLQFWRHGVQMVATNWQTYDLGTEINDAMFASGHDRLGYVPKPVDMRQDRLKEGPSEHGKKVVKFSVKVISARHLTPAPGTKSINPYLEVEIFSADNPDRGIATAEGGVDASAKGGMSGIGKPTRRRTKIIEGNGWNPKFDEQIDLRLETAYPSLVFVRFTAWHSPDGRRPSDQKEPLAAHTAKLGSLQQGYRLLHLRDKRGDHTVSKLLVKIDKEAAREAEQTSKSNRDQSPESPRASEEDPPHGRSIFRTLFNRTPSERRKAGASEPSSGNISRTMSIEK